MQILWEKYEVFKENPQTSANFPITKLTATNFELKNSQISITDLDQESVQHILFLILLIPTHVQ